MTFFFSTFNMVFQFKNNFALISKSLYILEKVHQECSHAIICILMLIFEFIPNVHRGLF